MRRADRLFEIVQALRGGRLLTAQAIAEQLEVSKRTIYRDLAHLQACGVPIEGEAGVGYLLSSDYHMPPLTFTADEITALVLGARMVQTWASEDLAKGAAEALVKIDAVIPAGMRSLINETQLYALSFRTGERERALLDELRLASRDRHYLDLDYLSLEGKSSTRRVRPLGLYFWGQVWTLLAWCELREGFRSFRVDHIEALRMSEAHFPHEAGKELKDFIALRKQQPEADANLRGGH
nr:YafY family protein [uncultured Cohaesibacter sp.]